LGRNVAQKLREAGAQAEKHDDHFAEDTPDVDWLAEVGVKEWVVLTKDKRIRHNPLEKKAVEVARLRVFTLSRGNMTGEQMAQVFVKHLATIERLARKWAPPFVAVVSDSGVRGLDTFSKQGGEEGPGKQ
jgi:hypothetical protein